MAREWKAKLMTKASASGGVNCARVTRALVCLCVRVWSRVAGR